MINAILWKIKLDILSAFRYKFSITSDLIVMILLFMFFIGSNTGASFNKTYGNVDSRQLLFAGYIMWTISIAAISSLTLVISKEAKNGTLQVLFHSKYPLEIILFGEFLSSQMIHSVIILILSSIAYFLVNIPIVITPELLIPIIFCGLGMFGMGLFLTGMSIFFKRIGAVILLVQLSLLFVTDTIPTAQGIKNISKFIPLTIANDVVRKILSNISYSQELINLIIISAIWILVGIIGLRFFINRAKEKGNLFFY